MAVTRTSVGATQSGIAGITVTPGAGAAAGNFGVILVETANQTMTTPSGWVKVFEGTGTGTAGAAGATRLIAFSKDSITSTDISTGVALADSGDHQIAAFLTYSGVDTTVGISPSGEGIASTATTSVSTNGNPNIKNNGIALAVIGTDRDSATASTNSSPVWSGITGSNSFIVNDSTASGAGGGLIVNELVATSDTTGAGFSCTITSSIHTNVVLGLRPPVVNFYPVSRYSRFNHLAAVYNPAPDDFENWTRAKSHVREFSQGYNRVGVTVGQILLTGQAITVNAKKNIVVTNGTITLTGQTVVDNAKYDLVVTAAQLHFNAQALTVNSKYGLAITAAQLHLNGQTVAVNAKTDLVFNSGAITFSGQTIALLNSKVVPVTAGQIVLTPEPLTLNAKTDLVVTAGAITFAPQSVALPLHVNIITGGISFVTQTVTVTNPATVFTYNTADSMNRAKRKKRSAK